MAVYVRFRVNGDQQGLSVSDITGLDDLGYREANAGYIEGTNACKLVGEVVELMTAEEYTAWQGNECNKSLTQKETVIADYKNIRTPLGKGVQESLHADIVILYNGGETIANIIALENKFRPILQSLTTGDFISCENQLQGVTCSNQLETDFKANALNQVQTVITDKGWS